MRGINRNPKGVLWMLGLILLASVSNIGIYSQKSNQQGAKKTQSDPFGRPAPTRPIKPEIPSENRYQPNKVFLEKADSLYARDNEYTFQGPQAEKKQMLKGNVVFRQGGMWMYCDSAYYFPEDNSLDAFGNVKMEQGDTLFVYAQTLYYDGNRKFARLRRGPGRDVKLVNRNVTLTTDSLDYDMNMKRGWYDRNGTITDDLNTLTSVRGEYSPETKIADFSENVVLINRKDGYKLLTEHLIYNTRTHIASIDSPTTIYGENDTIYTTRGEYNTENDRAVLESRSTIIHKDSSNNVTTLEGDSIIYDKVARISRAYMFRAPWKEGKPMVLTDTAHNATLIGGFGYYNGATREAFATENPLLMEYSRPDTLFLRADTIFTFIDTRLEFPPLPEDRRNEMIGRALEEQLQAARQAVDEQNAANAEAGIDEIVELPDSLPPLDMAVVLRRDSSEMVPCDYHVARAYNRARFFKKDIQGVADSIYINQADSILHMYRKPVVWSGERQIYGNLIDVHFNDSTADWAALPDYGVAAEALEDDYYNQLAAKKMFAVFENNDLKRLDAEGNVEVIILPQENDSTYNKLVNAESQFLQADLSNRTLDKLKMWPDVSGTVTPLFEIKQQQKHLSGFRWYEAIRPRREWYGGSLRWADDLGDIPDALEQYFNSASETISTKKRID